MSRLPRLTVATSVIKVITSSEIPDSNALLIQCRLPRGVERRSTTTTPLGIPLASTSLLYRCYNNSSSNNNNNNSIISNEPTPLAVTRVSSCSSIILPPYYRVIRPDLRCIIRRRYRIRPTTFIPRRPFDPLAPPDSPPEVTERRRATNPTVNYPPEPIRVDAALRDKRAVGRTKAIAEFCVVKGIEAGVGETTRKAVDARKRGRRLPAGDPPRVDGKSSGAAIIPTASRGLAGAAAAATIICGRNPFLPRTTPRVTSSTAWAISSPIDTKSQGRSERELSAKYAKSSITASGSDPPPPPTTDPRHHRHHPVSP